MCLDGNGMHCYGHTLVRVGTLDKSHSFHTIAIALCTGKEGATEASMLKTILIDYLEKRSAQLGVSKPVISTVMVDGSSGFRQAFSPDHGESDIAFGMCYFHVVQAIRQYITVHRPGSTIDSLGY